MSGRRGFPRPDDLERIATLRHMGGPPFGPGPGGPFGGGRGRARRGDVRMAVLMLLADEPRNGYQLMQAIEERSGGRWRPSPGSVYPTLSQLEDEGLIRSLERDGTKLFEITDAGREQLSDRDEAGAPWDSGKDPDTVADMRSELKQLHMTAGFVLHAGGADQIARGARLLAETRRSLYKILAEDVREQ